MPRGRSALQVDRVSYLLQEIYGIENKNNQETKVRARDPLGGPGHVPSALRWLLGGGDLPGSPILARALTCLPLEAPGPQAPSLFLHS